MGIRRDFVFIALLRGNDYLPPLICEYDASKLWERYLHWRHTECPEECIVKRVDTTTGIVGINRQEDVERLALQQEQLASFMTSISGSGPGRGGPGQPFLALGAGPGRAQGPKTTYIYCALKHIPHKNKASSMMNLKV